MVHAAQHLLAEAGLPALVMFKSLTAQIPLNASNA